MKNDHKHLKSRLRDYQRYVLTLFIVSSYFYLGAIDAIYIHPTENGNILLLLSVTVLGVGAFFLWRFIKLNTKLQEK